MEAQVYKKLNPHAFVSRFLANSVRPDGRSITDPSHSARKPSITTGSIGTALGSAMLKLGRTTVVAGVNATLQPPAAGEPDAGTFEVRAEALPFASRLRANISSMAPNAILSRHLRSVLAPHIDLKSLCVEQGVLVWHIVLTTYCIDNDGNVDDAALLAAVAALQDVRLPTVTLLDENDDMDADSNQIASDVLATVSEERSVPLQFDSYPLSVTFALIGEHALLDPTLEEEEASDSSLTLLVKPSGELRAALKPGGVALPQKLFRKCVECAASRAPILAEALTAASKR